ncbi:MAG: transferrin-binding protein-like solute binding protein [Paracoccaceae bacterium]
MSIRTAFLSCTLLAAGACGPVATTTEIKLPAGPPPAPYTVAAETKSLGNNTVVNNADVTQIVVDGRILSGLQSSNEADTPAGQGAQAIAYYRTATSYWQWPVQNLWRGKTNSGAGEATLIKSHDAVDYAISTIELERTGDTTIPVSGTTEYKGLYAGTSSQEGGHPVRTYDNSSSYFYSGDVNLSANFATARVSGAITNRKTDSLAAGYTNIRQTKDITLELGGIENGAFFGTATSPADDPDNPDPTVQYPDDGHRYFQTDGTYEGLFIGANADEIVGTITVDHVRGGETPHSVRETGIFVLNQDTP